MGEGQPEEGKRGKSARGSPAKGRGGGLSSDTNRSQRQKNAQTRKEETFVAQGAESTAQLVGKADAQMK